VQPDDRKAQGIHEMKHTETNEDIKRAIDVINYLARFMPHQLANSKILRSLLNEDTA